MSKQRTYANLEIDSLEYGGHGVAKPEGRVVFVEGALPGEIVDVSVFRKKKSHAFARVDAWHGTSPARREPFCAHFDDCGGCTWQYLPYPEQLAYKEQFVGDILRQLAGIKSPPPLPIIGCDSATYYRNKLDFSFAPKRWITPSEVEAGTEITDRRALGFHVKGRFDRVLDVEHCYLQADPSNAVRTAAREIAKTRDLSFHDPKEHMGLLRSLIVRTTQDAGAMVILVIADDRPDIAVSFLDELRQRVPAVVSGYYIVNPTRNDDVSPHHAIHVFGDVSLTERCTHLRFLIHPKSFYQTNSGQAEKLYGVVRQWMDADGSETVLDLYCGIGSIGLFVADRVSRVVGVESIPEAAEKAAKNATLNGISNISFLSGDVRTVLKSGTLPNSDIVILDPPRAGLHPDVLESLVDLGPRQIIYVSCKPSTQARDLTILADRYRIERIQPVDMFPQTFHIENIVDLRLR